MLSSNNWQHFLTMSLQLVQIIPVPYTCHSYHSSLCVGYKCLEMLWWGFQFWIFSSDIQKRWRSKQNAEITCLVGRRCHLLCDPGFSGKAKTQRSKRRQSTDSNWKWWNPSEQHHCGLRPRQDSKHMVSSTFLLERIYEHPSELCLSEYMNIRASFCFSLLHCSAIFFQ